MKTLVSTTLIFVVAAVSHAQTSGVLESNTLQVGARLKTGCLAAKVNQITSKDSMLITIVATHWAIEEKNYRTLVKLKAPTEGLVDDATWESTGGWQKIIGSDTLVVTGTERYRTVTGATKTVFVLEPYQKTDAEKEAEAKARKEAEAKAKARVEQLAKARAQQEDAARTKKEETARREASPEYRVAKAEYDAARKLKTARQFERDAKDNPRDAGRLRAQAADHYQEVVRDFPGTRAAADARDLLNGKEPEERPMPPNPSQAKTEATPSAPAAKFVGKWRIVGGGDFTLTRSFKATKSHAPDARGTWEIVGNEARITWDDGWKDIFRVQEGHMVKVAFAPETSWTDPPASTKTAIKEADKKRRR